jgi:hypothetical protein
MIEALAILVTAVLLTWALVYSATSKHRGGIYLWRTNKPNALLGLPLFGRHNAYVGMTNSYAARGDQHLLGSVTYGKAPASWSDLKPKCYKILPLPAIITHGKHRRKIMKAFETAAIGLLIPVYNVTQQAPWNLRKISRNAAAQQRRQRDEYGIGYKIARLALRVAVGIGTLGGLGYVLIEMGAGR